MELLRRHSLHDRAGKAVVRHQLGRLPDRRHLIGTRSRDQQDRTLDIVAMVGKVRRQPVQQSRVPWTVVHFIGWLNQSAPHHFAPETVDKSPRESAVGRAGEGGRKLRHTLGARCGAVNTA